MQMKTKQRLVGAVILLGLSALCLSMVFKNRLPILPKSTHKVATASSSHTASLVYNLPLQGQQRAVNEGGTTALFDTVSVKELRERAAKTELISAHILHQKIVPAVKKSPVKRAMVAQVAQKPARVLSKKQVLLQSSVTATPEAWVLKMASFAEAIHAKRLVEKLQLNGIDAYTKVVSVGGRKLIQVYAGPYIRLDKVKHLQHQLVQQLHMKGIIRKYSI